MSSSIGNSYFHIRTTMMFLECDISSSKIKPVLTQAICGREKFKDSTNYPRIKQNTDIFTVYNWDLGMRFG